MPVSESEKHQKSGLHSRFIDRLEHVPIKKRRFLYMSPSSTPQPPLKSASLGDEENTNPSSSQYSLVESEAKCPVTPKTELGSMPRDAGFQHDQMKINENLQSTEDFSGISILAAAACCSSSLGKEFGYAEDGSGVEEPSTHECLVEVSTNSEAQSSSKGFVKDDLANPSDILVGGSSSCVTTSIVGELATTSTAEYASGHARLVEKGFKERSCGDDTPTVSSELSSLKDEEIVGGEKQSFQELRLHWDLNVVMDAWEQPYEDPGSHTSDHVSDAIGAAVRWDAHKKNDEAYGLLSEAENSTCDDEKLPRVDARRLVNQIFQEGDKGTSDKCDHENPPSESKRVLTSLVDGLSENLPFLNPLDIKGRANHEYIVESMTSNIAPVDSDLKYAPGPNMLDTKSVGASAEKDTNVSATDSHMSFSAAPAADMKGEDTLNMEMTGNPSDNRGLCLKDDGNDCQGYMALQFKRDAPLKGDVMEICEPQRSSRMHELAVASDPRVGSNGFSKDASDKAMTDGQGQVSIGGDTIASAKRSEQEFISGACFDPCSRGRSGTDGELLEDCDSQYEDGELREPTGLPWQEYDAAGGEAEHSRYAMKDIDSHIPESGHIRKTKHGDAAYDAAISSGHGVGIEPCVVSGKPVTDDGAIWKDNVLPKSVFHGVEKMKGPASAELSASDKISQTTLVSNDCDRNVSIYRHGSRSTVSDVSGIGAGSVVYRRGLRSCIEGPVTGDYSFGDDRAGNRSKLEGCAPRWERGSRHTKPFERFRHMQNQPSFRPGNSWSDSPGDYRGVKRNCLPNHPLVKPNDDDASAKGVKDGTLNIVSSSNCPSTDDPSIADAGATANFHLNPKVGGDPGSDRLMSRERLLRRDPHIELREEGRGRYHGLSPEDAFVASLKYRRPLSQRDRSPSPCERRRYLFARQSNGSSSRSRSRSPKPRFSPRGRCGSSNFGGAYGRHKNRSPNFRPEDRMLRMRSPTRQSEFGADHVPGFRTFQRRHHGSLPSPSWINTRKDEVNDFNYKQQPIQEKSPGRVHLQCDGENFSDPAQNSKPNVYCRLNGGRLPEADAIDEQPQFEGNYVNKRHFGPMNRDRRGCEGGSVKRLHRGEEHGGDDAFVFRGGLKRADNRDEDKPRRFGGDNNYMCERDGRLHSSSKCFGFERMDSLGYKSGDSYRSANSGRFNGMDRAGGGHRHVNSYDDRRRYFGSAQRWGDTESMRRQPGHEVDGSFTLTGTSCNEDATDCNGGSTMSADGCVDDQLKGQREEQLDLSGQENKLSSRHPLSVDVQAPPECEAAKVSSPS